ncbi:MAG: T9SS type A sorting domain-containing protein [candidate division KSB1 bacterium]|nr:T9SS type A sorting domain-containing protein [candidate division KSB1 bacterium]
MRRVLSVVLLMVVAAGTAFAGEELTTVWERNVAKGTLPPWFDTAGHFTRGFDYGKVDGHDRLYVVSRFGGSFIYVLDAATGDSLGMLDNTGIAGGTYAVSDVGVSADGKIYVCNLAVGGTFKVYVYNTEADSPKVAITYDATGKRLGDKITVTGSAADNSLVIWAASANSNYLVKFTTADSGATFTPTELDIGTTGGSASVGPLPDGSFYWNAAGKSAMKFTAEGVPIGTVPGSVVATGSNAIRYIGTIGPDEFFITFQYGAGNENARVVRVPGGDVTAAETYSLTPPLGTNANPNGTGDVAVQDLGGGKYRIFVLGTNNGLGAYEVNTNFLKGLYYVGAPGTRPGGGDPEFASLKAACDALNQRLIMGNCAFLISSDLTEPVNVALGVDPAPYTVTFKPAPGVTPTITFTQSTDSPGFSGAWVIGTRDLSTTAGLVRTTNIVIDGSNQDDGTTRDMLVTTAPTAHSNATPLRLVGDVNNTVVKNLKVVTQQNVTYGVLLTYRYDSGKFFLPDTVTVENCEIINKLRTTAQGLAISTFGTPGAGITPESMKGIVFKGNRIEARTRGIFLNWAGSTDIIGNEIYVNQTDAGYMSFGIFGYTIASASDVLNIYNNKIVLLSTANNTSGDYGIIGIQCGSKGTYNVYNNFITGFDATTTAPNPNLKMVGIRLATEGVVSNVFHNTIYLRNLSIVPGTGVVLYTGLEISNGINTIKNNIVYVAEGDFKSYAVYRSGTAGTLDANYNDYYVADTTNARTGFWNGTDATTLAAWQALSGLDSNSVAKAVELVSETDLHLTGASVGDFDLAGTPIATVTTDIDGEPRSATYPYMGADEGAVELLPPTRPLTVAEARIDADGDFRPDLLGQEVTLRGVINSPNFGTRTQYYMQDPGSAGIVLYSGTVSLNLKVGDLVEVKGKIDQFRGITEIVPTSASDVTVVDSGIVLTPKLITIPELNEENEALLVQLNNVWIVNPQAWPPEGQNSSSTNRVLVTDGVDTTYIFIDKETDLDGWTPPSGPMNLIALCDQYTTSATRYDDGYSLRGRFREDFMPLPPVAYELPIFEGATNGTFDLNWEFNATTGPSTLTIADSTGSAWGSHVLIFTDSGYTGIAHVKNALFKDYTVSADIYLVGPPDPVFPLYTGLAIKSAHDELKFYRVVFRNSTAGDNGQIRLQGYDGASWHISKYWNPGVDFPALQTGWHNFKVTVIGNLFWVWIDGMLLPGCPYADASPFLSEGYPGIYVYNATPGTVIFDNFSVTEPVVPVEPAAQLTPLWAKTQAAGTLPAYFAPANYTRGMAYGKVNGNDRLYVVTRSGTPHRVVIYDAFSGDSLGVMEAPQPPVGFFPVNAVDVSDDGIIFVCNMTLDAAATPFTVYRWDSETATPTTVISFTGTAGRMGDMISVYGKASDNTLTIYAGVANGDRYVKFTTSDNGHTFTGEVITLGSGGSFSTLPNIAQAGDGSVYVKSYGRPLVHLRADGSVIDTVATTVFPTGVSKIKYFEHGKHKAIVGYIPDLRGEGNAEKLVVVDVAWGDELARQIAFSPSIGRASNLNGTGSVDVAPVDANTIIYYILGTNNGVAAFSNNPNFVVQRLDTLFYGNTPILAPNPYGPGWIAGTNSYGDIGKYQRFDFKVGDELFGFRYYFAYKEVVDTPDTLTLVVKTVAANGAPDSLLASLVTTTDVLDTTGAGNLFFLSAPLRVKGPAFIGFEWPATANDAFAIFMDKDGEGNGANRAWERFGDGSYNDFGTTLNPTFSWAIDVDLWIAAYYKKAIPASVEELTAALPTKFELTQNYPNPFNPTTTFRLALPKTAEVRVTVYNMLGQRVAELFHGHLPAGVHTFTFDGRNCASGVYFYRVEAGDFVGIKRMVLVK